MMARKRPNAFTLIELLVVIAIIGLLVALLIPAVNASRRTARLVTCKNHLKQIGVATTNYVSARGGYPAARISPRPGDKERYQCGGNEPSWLVHLLPYLEEDQLYGKWSVFRPFTEHAPQLRNQLVETYICPERGSVSLRTAEPPVRQVASSNRRSDLAKLRHPVMPTAWCPT